MLSWVSVNATNGRIIADLPTLKPDGSLNRTIGRHETQTATLPLDGAPKNWRQATRKKAVFLVALSEPQENEPRGVPLWGGMVIDRTTSHKDDVKLALATAEDYFNDRYVGDETFPNTPQNTIVKTLVEKYAKTGTKPGLPIRVQELPGPNPFRKRDYLDTNDKTLTAVLEELSGLSGGPEWTIGWEWTDERLTLVLFVGARIGTPAPADHGPAAQFYLPGNVQNTELVEGFRRGEGANDVMATSSGAGEARPQSPHQTNTGDLRPTIEHRWSPTSNITETSTLTDHAQRALADMKDGTVALTIVANRAASPRFGIDYGLGDDVGFDLAGRAWPQGVTGVARAIGIQITNKTASPVLNVTGIEGID